MSEVKLFDLEIPDQFRRTVFFLPIETVEQAVNLDQGPTMVSYRLFEDYSETADYFVADPSSDGEIDSMSRLEYVRLPNGVVQFNDGYEKLPFEARFDMQEGPGGSLVTVFDTTGWVGSNTA